MGGRIGPSQQRAETEEYDGSSWSEQNDLSAGRQRGSGAGSQTAGLYFGGIGDPDATEEYDGTNWTSSNALISGRHALTGAGASNTAGLVFGGNSLTVAVEGYDGTAWSTRPSMATTRFTTSTTLSFRAVWTRMAMGFVIR